MSDLSPSLFYETSANADESESAHAPTDDRTVAPQPHSSDALLSTEWSLCFGEMHTADEQALHCMLQNHPMLASQATNNETLALIGSMFERTTMVVNDVPVIPKSYDDTFLRPPNKSIGERECSCADKCICALMARVRYGPGSEYEFIGTEFLLPAEQDTFIKTGELPSRRRKCLVCTRYWQTYIYIRARTDPTFRLHHTTTSLQVFANVVGDANGNSEAECNLNIDQDDLVRNSSVVSADDGYKPHAMLFVDEGYVDSNRLARSGSTVQFLWKPTVKFCSTHYVYVKDPASRTPVRLIQSGIGTDDVLERVASNTGGHFVRPPTVQVAPSAASTRT